MSLFFQFIPVRKNCAKTLIFVATILLAMNLFASVDSIIILNGSECEQTGICQYRMQFSSWFSINPSYPEDYDYYRNIKDPAGNWHSTNGTLLDCMSDGVCTAIASDHVDFTYTHPDSGSVVVNMQVEDSWGGDYAAATLYHGLNISITSIECDSYNVCKFKENGEDSPDDLLSSAQSGTAVYVGRENDLIVIDNSTGTPSINEKISDIGNVKSISINGSAMYVVTDNKLKIYNITNVLNPAIVNEITFRSTSPAIFENNFLYVGYDNGIAIYEFSGTAIINHGSFLTGYDIIKLAKAGNNIVAVDSSSFIIIDATGPSSMSVLSTTAVAGIKTMDVFGDNVHIYREDGTSKEVNTYSLSDQSLIMTEPFDCSEARFFNDGVVEIVSCDNTGFAVENSGISSILTSIGSIFSIGLPIKFEMYDPVFTLECGGHGTLTEAGCNCDDGYVHKLIQHWGTTTHPDVYSCEESPCYQQNCSGQGECEIHYTWLTEKILLFSSPICNCNYGYRNVNSNGTITCEAWIEEEMGDIIDTTTLRTLTPDSSTENIVWGDVSDPADFYVGNALASLTIPYLEDVYVTTYEGKFKSWEFKNGNKNEIDVHFYAAKPAITTGKLPLLIYTHGAGGAALYELTNKLAAELNMFVIFYSGPGRGIDDKWSSGEDHTSLNFYDDLLNYNKMFDVGLDPRGSWFWGHAAAGMRAITLASIHPDVDINNVAMSGGSAGGMATLIASSVDDRIDVAVTYIASLALEDAVLSGGSLLNTLKYCSDVRDTTSFEWRQFIKQIAGKDALITENDKPTLFVNGATDEIFPFNALNNTFDAMTNNSNRLSIQWNKGHGAYWGYDNDAMMRLNGGVYHYLKHHLHYVASNQSLEDNRIPVIPNIPVVSIIDEGSQYRIEVTATEITNASISEVKFYYSNDGESVGLLYQEVPLSKVGSIYKGYVNDDLFNNFAISFADVKYILEKPTGITWTAIENYYNTFYISSEPNVPSIPVIGNGIAPTDCSFLPLPFDIEDMLQ